jgi:hypothetical protein
MKSGARGFNTLIPMPNYSTPCFRRLAVLQDCLPLVALSQMIWKWNIIRLTKKSANEPTNGRKKRRKVIHLSAPTKSLQLNLETAVDRYTFPESRMFIGFRRVFTVHHLGANATGSIAHFSAPLNCVTPPMNIEVPSSSRLAKVAEKCTLEPVQLPFLG